MFEEKLDALICALSEWIEDRKGEMRTWETRERERPQHSRPKTSRAAWGADIGRRGLLLRGVHTN